MQLLLSVLRCLHVCECPVYTFFLPRDALKHRGNVNKNVFCWYLPKLQLFVPQIVEHLCMGYINKNMSLAWGVVCIRRPQNTFLFVRWQNPYVISPYKKTLYFFCHIIPKIDERVLACILNPMHYFVLCRIESFSANPGHNFSYFGRFGNISAIYEYTKTVNTNQFGMRSKLNKTSPKSLWICIWVNCLRKCSGLGVLCSCICSQIYFWLFSRPQPPLHSYS